MCICEIGASLNLTWELSSLPIGSFLPAVGWRGQQCWPSSPPVPYCKLAIPTASFILAPCRSWLWMLRTPGSDWRACQRTQTTQCSCRQLRMPQGAASPLLPSPQVRDLESLWCLLLPTWCLPLQRLCWALASKEPIENSASSFFLTLSQGPARKSLPLRLSGKHQPKSVIYIDQLRTPSRDVNLLLVPISVFL